ncbi:MAG: acylneuraminate cytidylyltransferase family protein [Anaerolineales bacterium]|nr:acylneuraminate cytidylyltransferase family protein [Anaerolineales bacterium]
MEDLNILALIPARGGSKSIPHKNILPLAGHPLIAYSIAAALASELITRVVVSTDDEEIASVSRKYGAETPFVRPEQHAMDNSPDLPVFEHALEWFQENESYEPDIIVQLRPTSPYRRLWHIDQAIDNLIQHPDADSIRTVINPFQNPFKMWQINSEGIMEPLIKTENKEAYNMPRQALPAVYWQTGYVDAFWTDTVLTKKSMTGDRILPLVIDDGDWVDIDSPADWKRAELMITSGELTMQDLGYEIKKN